MDVEDVYLDGADGVRLHAVQAGTGQLVVLLHGFPQLWCLWRRQIEPPAALFHVVAPDTRGINLSSRPPALTRTDPSASSRTCARSPTISPSNGSTLSATTSAASSPGHSRSPIPIVSIAWW